MKSHKTAEQVSVPTGRIELINDKLDTVRHTHDH